jgi:hypothetical protein
MLTACRAANPSNVEEAGAGIAYGTGNDFCVLPRHFEMAVTLIRMFGTVFNPT